MANLNSNDLIIRWLELNSQQVYVKRYSLVTGEMRAVLGEQVLYSSVQNADLSNVIPTLNQSDSVIRFAVLSSGIQAC